MNTNDDNDYKPISFRKSFKVLAGVLLPMYLGSFIFSTIKNEYTIAIYISGMLYSVYFGIYKQLKRKK
jgi:hypothetical protein